MSPSSKSKRRLWRVWLWFCPRRCADSRISLVNRQIEVNRLRRLYRFLKINYLTLSSPPHRIFKYVSILSRTASSAKFCRQQVYCANLDYFRDRNNGVCRFRNRPLSPVWPTAHARSMRSTDDQSGHIDIGRPFNRADTPDRRPSRDNILYD